MGVEVEPDYYSDAASLCGMIAREYGWKESDILGLPIKRLFQYLNEIKKCPRLAGFLSLPVTGSSWNGREAKTKTCWKKF